MPSCLLNSSKARNKRLAKADKLSKEKRNRIADRMETTAAKFDAGHYKNIKDAGYDNFNTFEWIYEESTGYSFDPTELPPLMSDIRKFEFGLKHFNKELGKKGNWIASFFKLPRRMLQKTPELKNFQQEMVQESSFFRRESYAGAKKVNTILKSFKEIAGELGSNTKKYTKLERALDVALAKDDTNALQTLKAEHRKYLESGSGNAYVALMKAFQGADIETIAELPSRSSKSKMYTIMDQYQELRHDTSKSLIRGLQKVAALAKGNPKFEKIIDELKGKIRQIEFQRVVDEKGNNIDAKTFKADVDIQKLGFTVEDKNSYMDKKGKVAFRNYMPHYVLGMLKVIQNIDKGIRKELDKGQTIDEVTESIRQDFDKMDLLIDRVKGRSQLMDNQYSMDPFYFLKKYVGEVSIFNYRVHVKDTFKRTYGKMLSDHLLKARQTDNQEVTDSIESMMRLTKTVYETLDTIDPGSDSIGGNLMRIGTSLTYFRLLGGNIRSGARNATQRIHELNAWGVTGLAEARKYYDEHGSSTENRAIVNEQQKKYGLLWFSGKTVRSKLWEAATEKGGPGVSEASRGALGDAFVTDYGLHVDASGEIVRTTEGVTKKVARATAALAEKSAFAHRVVEDWNRSNTFRVAFALAHQNLKSMSDVWKSRKSGKETPEEVKKWEANEAGKIAYNAVLDIHYEYAKWAKAKALQGGPGQFLGQFLHYRFSLFDMMYDWGRKAKRSAFAGDPTGEDVWRFMRLGATTAIISSIFAPIANVKFGSLFQNDALETAEAAYTWFATDRDNPEEVEKLEKVTYGQKGYYFLGPNVNFLMSMKELKDFYFMDERQALKQKDDIQFLEGDERNKRYKMMALINSQLARTWNYTVPLWYQRGMIQAAQLEFGFFPDKEIRDTRKKSKQWLGRHIHPSLGVKSKKRKKRRYSYSEQQRILRSLSTI